RTTRVGARFLFLAPADSLEEADRFVQRGASSPLLDALSEKAKAQPVDAQVVCVLDDADSGYRRRIQLSSVVIEQKPEDPPYLGLPGDPGSGGVAVDIDTYTRPEEEHFAKVSLFVQESYLKSRALAADIFRWLVGRQK